MKKRSLVQATCLLACGASLSAAQAQQAVQHTSEIIVTASRSEQDLQTAPVGATILNAQQIKESGALDATEAIQKLTGIALRSDQTGGRNGTLDIRGFGETAAMNTVVLIDGIKISENELLTPRLSSISANAIERIEIVHGSAGVVWGEGASGGVINVILQKSTKNGLQGQASMSVESFHTRDMQLGLQVVQGASDKRAMFDLNARDYATDGYRGNGANNQKTISLGLGTTIDQLSLRLRFSNDQQNGGLPGSLKFTELAANPRQTLKPLDNGNISDSRVSGTLEYKADGWTASFDAARREKEQRAKYHSTAGALETSASSKMTSTQLSPKLNFKNSVFRSAISTTLGSDHYKWSYRNDSTSTYGNSDENAAQKSHAIFGTTDWLLPTQTRVVIGWRKESFSKASEDPLQFVSYKNDDVLFARNVSLNQSLRQGFDAYIKTGASYRLANLDESKYQTTPLKPQTSLDKEVGLKWREASNTAVIRYFEQLTTDEIAYIIPTGAPFGSNINLDKTKRSGFELEGQVKVTSHWIFSGALQSISALFDSGANAGRHIPMVAEQTAVLRVGYQIDAKQRIEALARAMSKSYISNDNANNCSNQIPSNRQMDLSYRWTESAYDLGLAVNNLANQPFYSVAYKCATGGVYPEPGRILRATLKYNF